MFAVKSGNFYFYFGGRGPRALFAVVVVVSRGPSGPGDGHGHRTIGMPPMPPGHPQQPIKSNKTDRHSRYHSIFKYLNRTGIVGQIVVLPAVGGALLTT